MTLYILFVSLMNGIYFRIRYLQAIAYSMKRCIGPLCVERPNLCGVGPQSVLNGPTLCGIGPGPLCVVRFRAHSVW